MIRMYLDLGKPLDLRDAQAQWRFAPGLVPGEANEGLVARLDGSPARLADYDDSGWEVCEDIQASLSQGLTFAWYRITVTVPERVEGMETRGCRIFFETCIDDYGEVWVNGECDRTKGTVAGFNVPQRVPITEDAQPGAKYVIACLAANGPLGAPGGSIFIRYAHLGFENYGVRGDPRARRL